MNTIQLTTLIGIVIASLISILVFRHRAHRAHEAAKAEKQRLAAEQMAAEAEKQRLAAEQQAAEAEERRLKEADRRKAEQKRIEETAERKRALASASEWKAKGILSRLWDSYTLGSTVPRDQILDFHAAMKAIPEVSDCIAVWASFLSFHFEILFQKFIRDRCEYESGGLTYTGESYGRTLVRTSITPQEYVEYFERILSFIEQFPGMGRKIARLTRPELLSNV